MGIEKCSVKKSIKGNIPCYNTKFTKLSVNEMHGTQKGGILIRSWEVMDTDNSLFKDSYSVYPVV